MARARLLERLRRRLPDKTGRALEASIALAERRAVDLYLVGGAVRDLFLAAPHVDVDLVVEGDALSLASAVGRKLRARVVKHTRFGTAVVQGKGFRLDLAQARTESYAHPGALPFVRSATLADDLARRDFTINAMALRLVGKRTGELIDPHGGQRDIADRRLRVLHGESFQDDATRILRGLRYAGRLGFRLQRGTSALLRRDLGYLDTISGARLRHELERIAGEEQVAEIVRRAARLGVVEAVHPALRAGPRELRALAALPALSRSHRDAALLCVLLADASAAEAEEAIGRLAMTGRQAGAVAGLLVLRAHEAKLARAGLRPSEAVRLLSARPLESIEVFALMARQRAVERARRYLGEWRFIRSRLNGRDLQALGIASGPGIGAALAALRAARLDGLAQSRADEIAIAEELRQGQISQAEVGNG